MRLEKLASRFRDGDSTQWIPPNPYAKGSYDQLKFCFGLLEEIFFQTGFETYRYDAFLALNWMQGLSDHPKPANEGHLKTGQR
jgi:hypothetical protein